MSEAILFINGEAPKSVPNIQNEMVICTDGAYNYLKDKGIRIDYLIGDLDSIIGIGEEIHAGEIVEAYDQNFTDFQKALKFAWDKGVKSVKVYGGSGKEQDHFLGNLSSALYFKDKLDIVFYEDEYRFWFANKKEKIAMIEGKILSLYPFPKASGIVTKGLKFPLNDESLDMLNRIGIRNEAIAKEVEFEFKEGELIVFVYH